MFPILLKIADLKKGRGEFFRRSKADKNVFRSPTDGLVGAGGEGFLRVDAVDDEDQMIQIQLVEVVNPAGGVGPSGINLNPGLLGLVIIFRPGVEDVLT